MTKLIFLEGVSGVGKSTMAKKLCEDLRSEGKSAKTYVEFDYANPIDFYCVAYYTVEEYETLCAEYPQYENTIQTNTVHAGNARLIHYFNENIPLFEEPLLSEFMEREFCYNPRKPVSFEAYTEAYVSVWKNFVTSLSGDVDFIIFDGSLLHHPINDMIRNYGATKEQVLTHTQKLLDSLGKTEYELYYLQTNGIEKQLKIAYRNRGQNTPDSADVLFWENRYTYDRFVLSNIDCNCRVYDVTDKWDEIEREIMKEIMLEQWDAYDSDLNKIEGKTLIRGQAIPEGMYHLVCDIIVRHTDGTYLLMQRDERKHYGGMWEATAGGSVLQGESPLACAIRELQEETGICAVNLTEVGRVVGNPEQSFYVEYLCVTDCDKDSIILQDGETSDYKWVTKDELLNMRKSELVTDRMQALIAELNDSV